MSSPVLLMTPLHPATQAELEHRWEVFRYYEAADPAALLRQLAPYCQVLVTSGGRGAERAVLAALPALRLVAVCGVGVDAVDLSYAAAHGIAVTNTPNVLTDDVADLALALMLASLRQVVAADRWVREGAWVTRGTMPLTTTVAGRRVGIVGMGRIGQAIAQRCQGFRTELAYTGPSRKQVSWPYEPDLLALARWADVLIAACPGGPSTQGLISRTVLEALGPTGHFVNVARGSVVDQAALIELLRSGRLAGAALDVFADEPHVPAELMALPQVVLQPHQASATEQTRQAMGQLTLKNIAAYVAGQPLLTPV
jgi:lactate dehydrogenase-like 2-hydroxyacid dehydrogenase